MNEICLYFASFVVAFFFAFIGHNDGEEESVNCKRKFHFVLPKSSKQFSFMQSENIADSHVSLSFIIWYISLDYMSIYFH